jgi:hypothetical protein
MRRDYHEEDLREAGSRQEGQAFSRHGKRLDQRHDIIWHTLGRNVPGAGAIPEKASKAFDAGWRKQELEGGRLAAPPWIYCSFTDFSRMVDRWPQSGIIGSGF